jgi:hypothetical protein
LTWAKDRYQTFKSSFINFLAISYGHKLYPLFNCFDYFTMKWMRFPIIWFALLAFPHDLCIALYFLKLCLDPSLVFTWSPHIKFTSDVHDPRDAAGLFFCIKNIYIKIRSKNIRFFCKAISKSLRFDCNAWPKNNIYNINNNIKLVWPKFKWVWLQHQT